MPRTVLGQKLDKFKVAHSSAAVAAAAVAAGAPGAAIAKTDPVPAFVGMTLDAEPVTVSFKVAAPKPDTENRLTGITVVVVPAGQGEPDTAENWLASSYPKGSVDLTKQLHDEAAVVSIAGLPDGDFNGQVLLTYDQ